MKLEKHISQLLYRYDCVIVPDFGGFLTQRNSALFNPVSYEFTPPFKELRFNANLKNNDGLLIHYISQVENESFENVSNAIHNTLKKWKTTLAEGEKLTLDSIGIFCLNEEGNLIFTPFEEVNYAKDTFGLAPVKAHYILREENQERTYFTWRKASIVAAGIALIGLIATIGYTNKNQVKYQMANMITPSVLEDTRDFSRFISHNPSLFPQPYQIEDSKEFEVNQNVFTEVRSEIKEEPKIKKIAKKKQQVGRYQLIGGAFKSMENAQKRLTELQNQGFKNAQILGNLSGMTIVSYETYTNHAEAQKQANQLKNQGKEVWLRIKNN